MTLIIVMTAGLIWSAHLLDKAAERLLTPPAKRSKGKHRHA